MYGFVIPTAGRDLLTRLFAGEQLILTRAMVGSGAPAADSNPSLLTDLVQPVAQATTSAPVVRGNRVDFTVEYRNDLNGGLENGFYLSEFGVFARDPATGGEVLVYYGMLGDYVQPVASCVNGAVDIRRFPVSLILSETAEVTLEYHPEAFLTAEDVVLYCETMVLPAFLERAEALIAAHNADPDAHPYLLGLLDRLAARMGLMELQYGTSVNGNPFVVTFESLDGVSAAGVWNTAKARMEF